MEKRGGLIMLSMWDEGIMSDRDYYAQFDKREAEEQEEPIVETPFNIHFDDRLYLAAGHDDPIRIETDETTDGTPSLYLNDHLAVFITRARLEELRRVIEAHLDADATPHPDLKEVA